MVPETRQHYFIVASVRSRTWGCSWVDYQTSHACAKYQQRSHQYYPLNTTIEDYGMLRAQARKENKFWTNWRGSSLTREAKSPFVFVVENITDAQHFLTHSQRIVPYPVTKRNERTSVKLLERTVHYESAYYVVNVICDVRKHKGVYELRIKKMSLHCDDDMTWKLHCIIRDDLPGKSEYSLYTLTIEILNRK